MVEITVPTSAFLDRSRKLKRLNQNQSPSKWRRYAPDLAMGNTCRAHHFTCSFAELVRMSRCTGLDLGVVRRRIAPLAVIPARPSSHVDLPVSISKSLWMAGAIMVEAVCLSIPFLLSQNSRKDRQHNLLVAPKTECVSALLRGH